MSPVRSRHIMCAITASISTRPIVFKNPAETTIVPASPGMPTASATGYSIPTTRNAGRASPPTTHSPSMTLNRRACSYSDAGNPPTILRTTSLEVRYTFHIKPPEIAAPISAAMIGNPITKPTMRNTIEMTSVKVTGNASIRRVINRLESSMGIH